MTYQHDDGSFSAFGNSDPSGSMWYVYQSVYFQMACFMLVIMAFTVRELFKYLIREYFRYNPSSILLCMLFIKNNLEATLDN